MTTSLYFVSNVVGYNTFFDSFYTDFWDIQYKQIQVGIVKTDNKFNSEIEIADLKADELAQKKLLMEQEKQAAKDAQMF